jgi:hypothetical protein
MRPSARWLALALVRRAAIGRSPWALAVALPLQRLSFA